jgi:ketosteroid isomerase-like protein
MRMGATSERVEAEAQVLAANRAFYAAFSNGDYEAMSSLWAEHAPSACLHPGMPVIHGRSRILAAWRQILERSASWDMRCRTAQVHLLGAVAYVTCLEASGAQEAHLVATNIFVLENGRWRMVLHQAGPLSQGVPEGPRQAVN